MMDLIKKIIELVYYYEADHRAGKPYWCDRAVIGLVVSLIAAALARWGFHLSPDLQASLIASITGIGMLASQHTGIVPKPEAPSPGETEPPPPLTKDELRNLTNLS